MTSLVKLLNLKNFFSVSSTEALPTSASGNSPLDFEYVINENNNIKGTKEDLTGVPEAFLIHDVLTADECAKFVQVAEEIGFREAGGAGDQEYPSMPDMIHPTDNVRAAAQASHPVLHHLWARMKDQVPAQVEYMGKKWRVREDATALNERFRFLRYEPNQRFWSHFDGGFKRGPSEQTYFTVILYLNDDFEGGETVFFPDDQTGVHDKNPRKEVRVRPVRGTALLFRHVGAHSPLHAGAPHRTPGKRKYVLRTDLMYVLEEA